MTAPVCSVTGCERPAAHGARYRWDGLNTIHEPLCDRCWAEVRRLPRPAYIR